MTFFFGTEGVINLSNPQLTYIRNLERNKIMFMPLQLLKNLHQEPSLFLIYFSPPTYRETSMAITIHARIYARGEVSFAKFLFLPSWFVKQLEANFFLLLLKLVS
jgi:hypothetical protein